MGVVIGWILIDVVIGVVIVALAAIMPSWKSTGNWAEDLAGGLQLIAWIAVSAIAGLIALVIVLFYELVTR